MGSKFQRWWLGACVVALLLASWVGGFSVAVTFVFIVLYLTGVTLIGPDDVADEPVDVVAAEPVDVVAAEPGWMAAFNIDAPAVPAEEPNSETARDDKSAEDDTAPGITADAEADAEGPADTGAVIVYEPAAAAEQETVLVEDATDSDTEAVVTLLDNEDDALLYPDDFDDAGAAEVGERSPA